MIRYIFSKILIVIPVVFLSYGLSNGGELTLAVSSNFTSAIKCIAAQFEVKTGHKVILIFGSTGKHYAQIKNGAPFDIFFAADTIRPELLEKERIAIQGSRFTYAVGKVVLWSPDAGYVESEGSILEKGSFRHLAIANPKLAPYGNAAREIMKRRGVPDDLNERLVFGENISQTFQFVKSGNAELGFVAYSQIKCPDKPFEGSMWEVPQELYTPIKQQAVLLKQSEIAVDFLEFVRSEETLEIIQSYGYVIP